MYEIRSRRLLCIARIDLACVGPSPDDDEYGDESLFATAVPAGPSCWEGLLEVATPRETDDRTNSGYVIKAWVIDPIAQRDFREKEWTDPCYDQWERICGYLDDWSQRVNVETGTCA